MSHSNSHLSFGLCLTHRHTPLTFHLLWIGIIQFTAPDGSSLVTDLYGGILHVLDFLVVSHRGKGTSMQAPRALLLCISLPSCSLPLSFQPPWPSPPLIPSHLSEMACFAWWAPLPLTSTVPQAGSQGLAHACSALSLRDHSPSLWAVERLKTFRFLYLAQFSSCFGVGEGQVQYQ